MPRIAQPKIRVKQLCKKCKKYYEKKAKFCQYYCDECREQMRGKHDEN